MWYCVMKSNNIQNSRPIVCISLHSHKSINLKPTLELALNVPRVCNIRKASFLCVPDQCVPFKFIFSDIFLIIIQRLLIGNQTEMGQTASVNFGEVHGITLSVGWFIFGHLGIWALNFKHLPFAVYIHIFCMSCAAFFMVLGPIMMIVQYGPQIITSSILHELWGFIQFCILPLIMLSGSICKISKNSSEVGAEKVYFRNKAHSLFGWAYFVLIQVPLLTGWYGTNTLTNTLFGIIIFVDVVSFPSYLYLKFFKKTIECESINRSFSNQKLREIKSIKDLRIYSENYFIFANYVYSIAPTLDTHPGGWKIIQSIRTRQVDRFLYGVDPIEIYNVPKVSHSFNSIDLAGPPIAALKIPLTYSVNELNKVKVEQIYCHDKEMLIHTVYLKLEADKKFAGYGHLSQIGQYYALTVNSQMTRLYTAVNFLQPQNIKIMEQIAEKKIQIAKKYPFNKINMVSNQPDLNIELNSNIGQKNDKNVLPLLIKRYGDGKFTSFFLSPQSKIQSLIISQPRGLGLSLDTINSTNIVVFAGGTGLYPYSDLIDLLFKSKLIDEGHRLQKLMKESNPILKNNPFNKFTFTFYIAVNQLSQLHPITLYQCNQLSSGTKVKCLAKVKGVNLKLLNEKYPHIGLLTDRFEKIISKELSKDPETTFYICGPVRLTKTLINQLQNQFVPPSNYKII